MITYTLESLDQRQRPTIATEHTDLGLFELSAIEDTPMPNGL
jgi:hypothetical protein